MLFSWPIGNHSVTLSTKLYFFVALALCFSTGRLQAQFFVEAGLVIPNAEEIIQYYWIDLDNDNDVDLLAIPAEIWGEYFRVYRNDDGVLTSVNLNLHSSGNSSKTYDVGDFDRDGDIDVLVSEGNIFIIKNNGSFNFDVQDSNIYANKTKIYWKDIDGDFDLDILYDDLIYLNNNGIYEKSPNKLPIYSLYAWADVNNDNLLDFVAPEDQHLEVSPLILYINQGNTLFKKSGTISTVFSHQAWPLEPFENKLLWLDADADYDLDLFLVENSQMASLYVNSYSESKQVSFTKNYSIDSLYDARLCSGDVDFDNKPDIMLSFNSIWPEIYKAILLKNTTQGGAVSFVRSDLGITGYEHISKFQSFDYDSDKDLDILVGGVKETRLLSIFRNEVGTRPLPQIPSSMNTVVTDEKVIVSWNKSQVEDRSCFSNLDLKRNRSLYKSPHANTSGSTLIAGRIEHFTLKNEIELTNLPAGTYEWSVQSIDHSMRGSAFSSTQTFEILEGPILAIDTITYRSVKLDWTFNGNASKGFSIYRKTIDSGLVKIATVAADKRSFIDLDIPENEYIEYFIDAMADGINSAPSNTIKYISNQFDKFDIGNFSAISPIVSDFDLDGDYDIGFTNGRLTNNGIGSFIFSASSYLPEGYSYESQTGRDIDNDGDTDLCALITDTDFKNKLLVFINANGIFSKSFETTGYGDISQYTIEDINQDGRQDIIFSHSALQMGDTKTYYKILLQSIDGNFSTAPEYFFSSSQYLGTFSLSDLNKDGFVDMIFKGSPDINPRIYENLQGQGFKQTETSLPAIEFSSFLDFNGDGIIDLLTGGYPLTFYSGSGDFHFAATASLETEFGMSSFRSSDFNLDGSPDLIAAGSSLQKLLPNLGSGNFGISKFEFDEFWKLPANLIDIEKDGDVDILNFGSTYNIGTNRLYRNQASNELNQNGLPSAPNGLTIFRDLNNVMFTWEPSSDDRTQSNWLSYNLSVVDNNGKSWISPETNNTGSFRRRFERGNVGSKTKFVINNLPAGNYAAKVQAVDASFALSGFSDIVEFTILEGPSNLTLERVYLNKVSLEWSDGLSTENKILVIRRDESTSFEVIAELPAGTTSYIDTDLSYEKHYFYKVVEVVDDIPTATSNQVDWNTTRLALAESSLPNFSGTLDVGDFTGDGYMDILVLDDQTNALFENSVAGWIERSVETSTLPSSSSFKFQDINGDNKLDLYKFGPTGGGAFGTEVFVNNGDNTFSSETNIFTSLNYNLIDWWDYDLDNDLDAYVGQESGYGPQTNLVLKNSGDGNFTTGITHCPSCNSSYASFGDFDRDGDEDIVEPFGNGYKISLNSFAGLKSGPTFSPQYFHISKGYPVDYNGDGWLDLYFHSTNGDYEKSRLFRNLGPDQHGILHFQLVREDFPTGERVYAKWVDYDHDGDLDLFSIGNESFIYQNEGNGDLHARSLPQLGWEFEQPKWLDVDRDGDIDLVVSGLFNNRKVLYNQTIVNGLGPNNQPPTAPINLTARQDSTGMYLNWNANTDDHSAEDALTFDLILYKNGKAITKGLVNPETGSRLKLQHGRNFNNAYLTTLTPGEYTWRVQAIDQSFSGSPLSLESSFTFLPLQPIISDDTTVYRCGYRIPVVTAKGENIEWFNDRNCTIKLASGEFRPEVSQVVFVTQTINGLRGFAKRVNVTVIYNDIPPNPTILTENPLPFCEYEAGFTGTVEAQGEFVRWYEFENRTGMIDVKNAIRITAIERSYYVTQTVNGCESEVEELKVFEEVIESTIENLKGQLIVREKEASFYQWFIDGESIPNSNNYFIDYYVPGAYTVEITKGNCFELSEPFVITKAETEMMVFPNPVTDNFILKIPPIENASLMILDINGKSVLFKDIDSSTGKTLTISSAEWNRGSYYIYISNGKQVMSTKILKL